MTPTPTNHTAALQPLREAVMALDAFAHTALDLRGQGRDGPQWPYLLFSLTQRLSDCAEQLELSLIGATDHQTPRNQDTNHERQ